MRHFLPTLLMSLAASLLSGQGGSLQAWVQMDRSTFPTSSMATTMATDNLTIGWTDQYTPRKAAGVSVGLGYTVLRTRSLALDIEGSYRFRGESALQDRGQFTLPTVGPWGSSDVGRYGMAYASLGGQLRWLSFAELGLGLHVRREELSLKPYNAGGTPDPSAFQSLVLWRPWVTLSLGRTFGASTSAQPFVSLLAALPLTTRSAPAGPDGNSWGEAQRVAWTQALVRSMAPKGQLALQVGMRF